MVVVRGGPGQAPTVLVVNSDPKPGRWKADLNRWLPELPAAEHQEWFRASASVAATELESGVCLSLDDAGVAGGFLAAWASPLAAQVPRVPLARPAKRPLSNAAQWGLSTVLALVALGACSTHYLWTQHGIRTQQAEIARRRGPIDQFLAAKKETEGLIKQRDTLGAGFGKLQADLEDCRKVLAAQQNRLRALLSTLAGSGLEEVTIEKIESEGDAMVLHGTCLAAGMADQLAAELAPKMATLGWRVDLPTKHAKELLADHGPWQFELPIRDSLAGADNAVSPSVAGAGTKPEGGKP
jgi:hypothetical protein